MGLDGAKVEVNRRYILPATEGVRLEGCVTETAAREIYGVAIKNGEIDHKASSLLRGSEGRVA